MATQGEKTTTKPSLSFFRLNINVYTDMVNRERTRAKDKQTNKQKTKEMNFVRRFSNG